MSLWQMVQDWYCVAWLWVGPLGSAAVKLVDGEWHCRQIVFTFARFSRRGFGLPWGK
jgi:hypothetical protein